MVFPLPLQVDDVGDTSGTSEGRSLKRPSDVAMGASDVAVGDQPAVGDIENAGEEGRGRKRPAAPSVKLPLVSRHKASLPAVRTPSQSWRTVLGPPPSRGSTWVSCACSC